MSSRQLLHFFSDVFPDDPCFSFSWHWGGLLRLQKIRRIFSIIVGALALPFWRVLSLRAWTLNTLIQGDSVSLESDWILLFGTWTLSRSHTRFRSVVTMLGRFVSSSWFHFSRVGEWATEGLETLDLSVPDFDNRYHQTTYKCVSKNSKNELQVEGWEQCQLRWLFLKIY